MNLCECLAIGLHALSLHTAPSYTLMENADGKQSARYETLTPGLYIRHDSGATAGAYRNSYGQMSYYGGWTFQTDDERFAITIGAVTGYGERKVGESVQGNKLIRHYHSGGGDVLPLVAPSVKFNLTDEVGARFTVLPPTTRKASAVLHFSIELKL